MIQFSYWLGAHFHIYADAHVSPKKRTGRKIRSFTFHGSLMVEHAVVSKREAAEAIAVLARALDVELP